MNRSRLLTWAILALLILANIWVWFSWVNKPDKDLHIKVYDIGQGDSIFIKTPDNYKILVDGGPTNKVIDYLNKDLGLNDRSLDLVVLTHPQADHMFGLIETLKRFTVKKVIASDVSNPTSLYKLWIDTLNNSHLKPEFVHSGQSITLSDKVTLNILWPKDKKPIVNDLNQAAIVIKLSYGNFDMLLTADADQNAQPYTGTVSHVEVLKVPHHGSKTALREDFLKQLKPDVSVVSVGAKNRYGHPNPETIKLLLDNSQKVFRTDKNGTVEFVSDGGKWYTRTEK